MKPKAETHQEEQPTQCPDCKQWECYDYNGDQVCSECYRKSIEELEYEAQS